MFYPELMVRTYQTELLHEAERQHLNYRVLNHHRQLPGWWRFSTWLRDYPSQFRTKVVRLEKSIIAEVAA